MGLAVVLSLTGKKDQTFWFLSCQLFLKPDQAKTFGKYFCVSLNCLTQHSDGELHLPTEDATGLQSKAKAPKGCRNPSSCAEDYVMVPAELSSVTREHP